MSYLGKVRRIGNNFEIVYFYFRFIVSLTGAPAAPSLPRSPGEPAGPTGPGEPGAPTGPLSP